MIRHTRIRHPQAGQLQRAPDARTLYLASEQPLRITSTGEALVVQRADGQLWRLPVARLLRIVCCSLQIDWSGAALALCLRQRIAVSWLDADGQAAGHLQVPQPQTVPLDAALETLAADDPEWPARYGHWLRHRRLEVLKTWGRQRQQAGQSVSPAEWAQAKQGYVYREEIPQVLPAYLGSMATALVAAQLPECGLQLHYWQLDGEALNLSADLARLLWAEMNLCSGALAQVLERPQDATTIFEHQAGALCAQLHGHLASLRVQALQQLLH